MPLQPEFLFLKLLSLPPLFLGMFEYFSPAPVSRISLNNQKEFCRTGPFDDLLWSFGLNFECR